MQAQPNDRSPSNNRFDEQHYPFSTFLKPTTFTALLCLFPFADYGFIDIPDPLGVLSRLCLKDLK